MQRRSFVCRQARLYGSLVLVVIASLFVFSVQGLKNLLCVPTDELLWAKDDLLSSLVYFL